MIIRRHAGGKHLTALASGQFPASWHLRHAAEKYAKFAYSTCFGFRVPAGQTTLEDGAHDDALAMSEEGHYWRVRGGCRESGVEDDVLVSTWSAWPDVRVRTWLFFDGSWQVRVHRLENGRPLLSAEAGHALPRWEAETAEELKCWRTGAGFAAVIGPETAGGVFDPTRSRRGEIILPAAHINLLHPRTVLPTLRGEHPPGVHWLVTLLPISHAAGDAAEWFHPAADATPEAEGVRVLLPSGTVRRFSDHDLRGTMPC